MSVRSAFLESSVIARDLAAAPEVAAAWAGPSVLPEFTVRGLVGHLYRATGSVEAYLDRGEPEGPSIDAPTYYSEAVGQTTDIGSDLHRAVRQRGEEAAANGHEALIADWASLMERMEERLANEPAERKVTVFKGLVLGLDDYLVTRLVELVVHCDDVAASVGIDAPALPSQAYDLAIRCLVEVARLRHGDDAVIRALARRERDRVEALRVL